MNVWQYFGNRESVGQNKLCKRSKILSSIETIVIRINVWRYTICLMVKEKI